MNYKRKHKGSRKKRLYNFLSAYGGKKHAKRFYESRLKHSWQEDIRGDCDILNKYYLNNK